MNDPEVMERIMFALEAIANHLSIVSKIMEEQA
jgi:hypothetical protein